MRSPKTHSPTRHWRPARALPSALLIALFLVPIVAAAQQPDTTEPVFGIGDDEFLIGGWNLPPPANITQPLLRAQESIAWARQMGVNVFRLPLDYAWNPTDQYAIVDALMGAADATDDIRFFITNTYAGDTASYGLEAKFYLIPDSVPYKDWKCRFLYLSGGTTQTNNEEFDDWKTRPREQVYSRSTIAANTRIADSIVIDWRPERTSWWSQPQQGGSWCTVPDLQQQRMPKRLFGEFWSLPDKGEPNIWGDSNYVAVTGHLTDEQPQAHPDSTVLWIDVYYDVGRGETYYTLPSGPTVTASSNISQYCTTLVVRQRDLARVGDESWNKYQVASLAFSTRTCTPTFAGPLHASAGTSRRINLRVRYAGNATVAIRSIALRDSIADMVLTENAVGIAVRDSMRVEPNAQRATRLFAGEVRPRA